MGGNTTKVSDWFDGLVDSGELSAVQQLVVVDVDDTPSGLDEDRPASVDISQVTVEIEAHTYSAGTGDNELSYIQHRGIESRDNLVILTKPLKADDIVNKLFNAKFLANHRIQTLLSVRLAEANKESKAEFNFGVAIIPIQHPKDDTQLVGYIHCIYSPKSKLETTIFYNDESAVKKLLAITTSQSKITHNTQEVQNTITQTYNREVGFEYETQRFNKSFLSDTVRFSAPRKSWGMPSPRVILGLTLLSGLIFITCLHVLLDDLDLFLTDWLVDLELPDGCDELGEADNMEPPFDDDCTGSLRSADENCFIAGAVVTGTATAAGTGATLYTAYQNKAKPERSDSFDDIPTSNAKNATRIHS